MTTLNASTQITEQVAVEVKRGRGRPSLDAATKAKNEVLRVMPLLANSHNSNRL